MTATALDADITTNHSRFAHLVKIDLDQAIFEAAAQHLDIWSRVLITIIGRGAGSHTGSIWSCEGHSFARSEEAACTGL